MDLYVKKIRWTYLRRTEKKQKLQSYFGVQYLPMTHDPNQYYFGVQYLNFANQAELFFLHSPSLLFALPFCVRECRKNFPINNTNFFDRVLIMLL